MLIQFNPDDPKDVQKVKELLQLETPQEKVEVVSEEIKPEKAKPKKQPKPAPEKVEKTNPAEEEGSPEGSITLDDLRSMLDKHVKTHRDNIVKKLKELGGKSLSTLPEEKYGEMAKFFNSL